MDETLAEGLAQHLEQVLVELAVADAEVLVLVELVEEQDALVLGELGAQFFQQHHEVLQVHALPALLLEEGLQDVLDFLLEDVGCQLGEGVVDLVFPFLLGGVEFLPFALLHLLLHLVPPDGREGDLVLSQALLELLEGDPAVEVLVELGEDVLDVFGRQVVGDLFQHPAEFGLSA